MENPTPLSDLSTRKQTIARHFAQANDYDQHAHIQQHICQHLLNCIAHQSQDSVLEVGAGTGQLTQLLAATLQSKRWIINELCAQQRRIYSPYCQRLKCVLAMRKQWIWMQTIA